MEGATAGIFILVVWVIFTLGIHLILEKMVYQPRGWGVNAGPRIAFMTLAAIAAMIPTSWVWNVI